MAQLDGSLEPLRDQALDLEAGVEALLRSLDQYGLALESDPDHLERIQDRLSVLKRLQRRYGLDLAGLIQRRDDLLHRLGAEGFAAELARLHQNENDRRQRRDQANAALHRERFKAASVRDRAFFRLVPLRKEPQQPESIACEVGEERRRRRRRRLAGRKRGGLILS